MAGEIGARTQGPITAHLCWSVSGLQGPDKVAPFLKLQFPPLQSGERPRPLPTVKSLERIG